jgi:hypothetical protein
MRLCVLLSMTAALTACGNADELSCPSFASNAEELSMELVELVDGSFSGEEVFTEGPGEVLQTDATWSSAVTRWGTDGGLTPDFTTDLVFVNRWDSCGGGLQEYAAWKDGARLRVVLAATEPDATCDMASPQIDLILVPHGGATDIAWCAPG